MLRPLSAAFALAMASCQPEPHVLMTVEDPDALANDFDTLWVGQDGSDLDAASLGARQFPITVLVTARRTGEAALTVETRDATGVTTARGYALTTLRREGSPSATVMLGPPCETDADCALRPCMICESRVCVDETTECNTNDPPVVQVDPVTTGGLGRYARLVTVAYTLADDQGAPCDLTVEVSADASTWWPATEANMGSDGVTSLSSDPLGAAHKFVWDALLDAAALGLRTTTVRDTSGGQLNVVGSTAQVYLRMTAHDGSTPGASASPDPFPLGNDAPTATLSVAPGVMRHDVSFFFTVSDPLSDTAGAAIEYTIDGGSSWLDATVEIDPMSSVVGRLVSLPTAPAPGVGATLVWKSTSDLPAAYRGSAILRLTPDDAQAVGLAVTSAPITLVNNTAPELILMTDLAAGEHAGSVSFDISLRDLSSDPTTVVVEYRPAGQSGSQPATIVSPSLMDLATSPAGVSHPLVWDARADLGSIRADVILTLQGVDADPGSPVQSPPFVMDAEPPVPVSYTYYDDDQNGRIDRVAALLSEPVTLEQSPLGGVMAVTSQAGSAVLNGSSVLEVSFNELWGTEPVELYYAPRALGVRDGVGNRMGPISAKTATLIDAAPPRTIAQGHERAPHTDGFDAGDAILLAFSEDIVAPSTIDAQNIDAVLALDNGHSWLDGAGGLGPVSWLDPRQLQIVLSDDVSPPSVAIGDTISPAPGSLLDAAGLTALPAVLSGTFSRRWDEYQGYPPSARCEHLTVYDSIRHRMLVFGPFLERGVVHSLSLIPGRERWTRIYPGGSAGPPPGNTEGAFSPNRDEVLVLEDGSQTQFYRLDLATATWTDETMMFSPTNDQGHYPLRKRLLEWDVISDRYVIVGGEIDPVADVDLWQIDQGTIASRLNVPGPPLIDDGAVAYDLRRNAIHHHGVTCAGELLTVDLTSASESVSARVAVGPGRRKHSLAYDATNDQLVTYGHGGPCAADSEVWALDLSSDTWSQIVPGPGPAHSVRVGAGMIFDPRAVRMVTFGGSDNEGGCFPSQHVYETWSLDLSGAVPVWSEITAATRPPPGTANATAVYDSVNQRMVVFGGSGPDETGTTIYYDDAYTFDLQPGSEGWSRVVPSAGPSPRQNAVGVYDSANQRMVIYSGDDGGPAYDGVWALDLAGAETWSEINPSGNEPLEGPGYSAVYDSANGRMILFSGEAPNSDTYALDLTAGAEAWVTINTGVGCTSPNCPPTSPGKQVAVYDTDRLRMVVFGGSTSSDVYFLSTVLGAETWTRSSLSGGPAGMSYASAVYDVHTETMFLFGGCPGENPCASNETDALWALDLRAGNEAWQAVMLPVGHPVRRYGHSGVYDAVARRMVVFGGADGLEDVWWY